MKHIPVYKAEAALSEQILQSGRIVYASELSQASVGELPPKTQAALSRRAFATNVDQMDLHYLKTVLASTVWNKNDDIFIPRETWTARSTPEDKPFNYEHDCADIIGHITSSYVIDGEGEVVADDSQIDDLPSLFHVVTGAVLYKYWSKAELQERMDTILAEISEGKWYVSMECLFTDFDYALKESSGECRAIARCQETAFLTKHLRAYGGNGLYKGQPVGRILKNIVFSGKGLVRKPANPDSLIFDDGQSVSFGSIGSVSESTFAPISHDSLNKGYISLAQDEENEEDKTKEETEEITNSGNINMTQPTIESLQADLQRLREENKELRDNDLKNLAKAKEMADVELESAKAKTAEFQEELDKVKQEAHDAIAKAEEEVKALAEQLEASKAENAELGKQLEKIEADKEHERRLRVVAEKLSIESQEAAELVTNMSALSADAFDGQVDLLAKTIAKSTPKPIAPKSTPASDPPKSTTKPAPLKGEGSDQTDDDVDALATAELNADPSLNASEEDSEIEATRAAVAAYFGYETEE